MKSVPFYTTTYIEYLQAALVLLTRCATWEKLSGKETTGAT